jgi:hypothetical protein
MFSYDSIGKVFGAGNNIFFKRKKIALGPPRVIGGGIPKTFPMQHSFFLWRRKTL